jgi:hypothetical protein
MCFYARDVENSVEIISNQIKIIERDFASSVERIEGANIGEKIASCLKQFESKLDETLLKASRVDTIAV